MTDTQPQPQPQPLFMTATDLPAQRPTLPEDFGVGSQVVVYENLRYKRTENRYRQATVITKARVWVTIKINDSNQELRFRLDDQTDGGTSNYPWRFYTPQQRLWDDVRATAFDYVWTQGLRLEGNSPWRDRIVELARTLWIMNNLITKD